LGFWPSRFSLLYSLLISAFSLLIAGSFWFWFLLRLPFPFFLPFPLSILTESSFRSTQRSTTYPSTFLLLGTIASVILLASFIFDAIDLFQCVATRSLSGGCFQAYCLLVLDLSLSSSLRGSFETLSLRLGCFPLNSQYFSTAVGLHTLSVVPS